MTEISHCKLIPSVVISQDREYVRGKSLFFSHGNIDGVDLILGPLHAVKGQPVIVILALRILILHVVNGQYDDLRSLDPKRIPEQIVGLPHVLLA